MSLLQDLFNIVETNGASGVPLTTPIEKYFSFDFRFARQNL